MTVTKPNIDFARAASLMDVVQKVASVAPAYMAISSVAMAELKEMNEEAQRYLTALGQKRLEDEQAAAAELNRQNQEVADAQTKIDNERKSQQPTAPVKPITIMPGEPDQLAEIQNRRDIPQTDSPQFPDDPEPVARRV